MLSGSSDGCVRGCSVSDDVGLLARWGRLLTLKLSERRATDIEN